MIPALVPPVPVSVLVVVTDPQMGVWLFLLSICACFLYARLRVYLALGPALFSLPLPVYRLHLLAPMWGFLSNSFLGGIQSIFSQTKD